MATSIELLQPNKTKVNSKDKTRTRETWGNSVESFLSLFGAVIGPGNIWRFPYIAYQYGGGAFLIPYATFAVLCGFPLFFAEVALGQYTRQGAVGIWKVAPIMKGIGFGSAFISLYTCMYFITTMGWSVLYLVQSLSSSLPWMHCQNWWNTNSCIPYENLTSLNSNQTAAYFFASSAEREVVLPIVEYWNNYVLRKSSGIYEIGSLENWPMVLCLMASWVMVYFCIFKGVKSTGKVVYFTATFPCVILVVLVVRSCTLDGAVDGIIYYLKPNITKLKDPNVWIQAGSQVCYSYGICFTSLVALGSYNKFNMNCYRHTVVLVTSCSLTSFVAGFAVFGVLGNLSKVLQVDIENVVASGPGLTFITYPIGLSLMPLPQLWNALFFLMFITVAIDGQFTMLEGLVTILCDYSNAFNKRRELVVAIICIALFLIGLLFVTEGGVYVFELFNNYAVSGIALLWLAMMESIAVAWVYGADHFYDNVNEMIGYYPSVYVKICLKYITPVLTMSIMMFYIVRYTPLNVMGYVYPVSANVIGWFLCMSSFLCVPGFAVYELCKHKGSLKEKFLQASSPLLKTSLDEKEKFRLALMEKS